LPCNALQAFLGDTTWAQLFPTQFATAVAFPCFNVKDLHTVDDGVWERLLPMLRQPGSWDLLVAHYLGVDHAGHAHGVDSEEMVAKLRQMDDHIQQVEPGPGLELGAVHEALGSPWGAAHVRFQLASISLVLCTHIPPVPPLHAREGRR
jgi:hypothetical protein